ncbi:unnamed protein product [Spirodela intermedia]|uniref:DYW domain-containing protein n=1 Tax=Spirodela intermedia TaxID=51605 RepID=A0A7I8L3J6_SPIIN|nr:unnamed protein product [Spirodela intermedia]
MSRNRADLLFARLLSSFSSSSSSSRGRVFSPYLGSSQQQDLVGGVTVPTSVRHLIGAAERADVQPDTQGAECVHSGFRSDPSVAPHERYQSGFNEDGLRSSQRDVYGFHGRAPLDRSFDGRSSEHSLEGLCAPNQHPYGFALGAQRSSGEFQRGIPVNQTSDGSRNWQQNLNGFDRGNPPEIYRNSPDPPALGNCGEFRRNPYGINQLDRGMNGFSERTLGEIHQGVQRKDDSRTAEQTEAIADGTCHKGTIEELDTFLSEGKAKEAVQVLGLLEKEEKVLDLDRCLKLLDACGNAKAVDEVKAVHDYIMKMIGYLGVRIYNRILSVYCKCELMDDARKLFETMPERNITSWETMMLGLADNGLGEDAIDLFNRFVQKGLTPDSHMFVALFHVCSSLGAVDEGMLHFKSMREVYGIIPTMEHYSSIVRMHGEAGYLDEALEFMRGMPTEPSVIVWEALMNCSRLQGNVELGDQCAEIVVLLDPSRLTGESETGLLPVKTSDMEKEKQRKANLLEVRSRVHEYRAGDTSHPEKDKIYGLIKGLAATLRESGYVPDTRFVLHDIEQESKEEALLAHSERLATAYGLISSSARSPIRIIKNLRICGDCHSYMKIMSKAVGRELIIRDAKRFHHFKDGLCSCKDYW